MSSHRCTKENSMSSHPTEFQGSVVDALREAIEVSG